MIIKAKKGKINVIENKGLELFFCTMSEEKVG